MTIGSELRYDGFTVGVPHGGLDIHELRRRLFISRRPRPGIPPQIETSSKSRTEHVPRHCVREVRLQIVNYKRFKALIAEWIDLSIEQCRLQTQSGSEN